MDDTVISGVNAEVLEADPVDTDDIARTGMEHVFFFRFQIQYVPCFRYDDIQCEEDGIKKDGKRRIIPEKRNRDSLPCCPVSGGEVRFSFSYSYNGIDNGTETEIQFFRRLFHTVLYPPLDHFHKTACNMVQKKFIGNILFLMV